jgi:hypothetical protein
MHHVMQELPPQSRISSRVDGADTTITIPLAAGASRGCLAGSWSAAAVFSFLCIVFIAQGAFSRNLAWTAWGVLLFILAGWQLIALRFFPPGRLDRTVRLEISPESLAEITGPADAPARRQWLRSIVANVRVEPESAAICIDFNDGTPGCRLLAGADPDELRWIAGQICLKWKIAGSAQ